jgi:hypothetical protein
MRTFSGISRWKISPFIGNKVVRETKVLENLWEFLTRKRTPTSHVRLGERPGQTHATQNVHRLARLD